MFNFNLKEAEISRAVKGYGDPFLRASLFLKNVFWILFAVFFGAFLFGFFTYSLEDISLSRMLGASLVFFALGVAGKVFQDFFYLKLIKPELKPDLKSALASFTDYNLAEYLSFSCAKSVQAALKWAEAKKVSELSSLVLFYFLLLKNPILKFVFSRSLISWTRMKGALKKEMEKMSSDISFKGKGGGIGFSDDFQKVFMSAMEFAARKNHERVETGDILAGLAKENAFFKKVLVRAEMKAKDVESIVLWMENLQEDIKNAKQWWKYENLIRKGSLGREWAAGFTSTLDKYSVDWTKIMRQRGFPDSIGHDEQIQIAERILSRREINNVLLVGDEGVGKEGLINDIACRSILGQSLPEVNFKRVMELDLPYLFSQIEGKEEVESVLTRIFRETVSAGNIILVINDFHNFVAGEDRAGVADISGALSSFLSFPQFQIIAVSNYEGLHQDIERNSSILSLFEKVEVPELSEEETLRVLEKNVPALERKYKIFVSFPALREAVRLSVKYLSNIPLPKKALDLLDEVCVAVSSGGRKIAAETDVEKVISEKTQIPIGETGEKEKQILLNLEDLIHQRIINQELAVKEVSSALRRARSGITEKTKPMGSFLFLGPTGVGKTETSKALAEIYFGSEQKMIRMDMSEFQQTRDISRLIGSVDEDGLLTTKVREDPFSMILLDEIEKAHPNILNLFLQILDEGFVTDGLGRKVDFKNSIIIATSNAGYRIILKAISEKSEWSLVKKELFSYLFERGIFRPEFVNRFDAVVVFTPLSKSNLLDISQLILGKLKKDLLGKDIDFEISQDLKEKIVELSYSPEFGAREMKRVVQDKIENSLARAVLGGEVKRGDRIKIDPLTFKVVKY